MANQQPMGTSKTFVQWDAVVTRCGCGDPNSHNGVRCKHPRGEATCLHCPHPCPHPQAVVPLGTVSYWHESFLRRLWYRFQRYINPTASV